ncbi:hypothetical protein [uncultured Microbulbifer sp.]|uniref:hypothetical protein n=1 Tax=uncultured Microbulbifer sp. TaxID=348147 RepID=UPI002623878D|nr:hypothetical protein [uncultured Microbulbifer sp.]
MSLKIILIKFLVWYYKVFSSFWKSNPKISVFLISAAVFVRFVNLVAFMLPLKVLLLASSEGVPTYFQSFISLNDKEKWILFLSIAAAAAFFLGLSLNALSKNMSIIGGKKVFRKTNFIAISVQKKDRLPKYYLTCCQILSSLIFIILGLFIIGLLSKPVINILLSLLVIEYFILARYLRQKKFKACESYKVCREKYNNLLSVFSYVNFIICFIVVLIPFIFRESPNVLISVITIILLRHTLSSLQSAVKECIKLWSWKRSVDPLVFRHVQLFRNNQEEAIDTDIFLNKEKRDQWVKRHVSKLTERNLIIRWVDRSPKNIFTYIINLCSESKDKSFSIMLQVYDSKWRHLLENEKYLFSYVNRSELSSPSLISSFVEGEMACQFLSLANNSNTPVESWSDIKRELLLKHWVCSPPNKLIEGYESSHALLHQRINKEFIAKAIVAVDEISESEVIDQFIFELDNLQAIIRRMPLYIHNRELNRENTYISSNIEKEIFLVSWGNWTLEPIGSKEKVTNDINYKSSVIRVLKSMRNDIRTEYNVQHLDLAAMLGTLEYAMNKRRYKLAITQMSLILASPVLKEECRFAELA